MKLYFILILLCTFCFTSTAQLTEPGGQDPSAYQAQRKKINQLLADRSSKFGQYDESLAKRTGIFGLKTKKDMQSSIDILTEIVKTDNNIFIELKTLLDYKDLEKTLAQGQVSETESRVKNFMTTRNKLQARDDKLKAELEKAEQNNTMLFYILIAFFLITLGLITYLYKLKN
jgi:hypothetical protein